MRNIIIIACLLLMLVGMPTYAAAAEAPQAMRLSGRVKASIDGAPVEAYETAVNTQRKWESRPLLKSAPVVVADVDAGSALVEILFDEQTYGAVESVTVRPLALGIVPEVNGNEVSFTASVPGNIVVEVNGSIDNVVHMFIGRRYGPEDVPDLSDPNVIYISAGIIDTTRTITLTDGQTVYIEEGAVLRGQIVANGAKDIKILGHGIIDGSAYSRWDDILVPIDLTDCENVEVRGVTILDPAAWTLNTYRCRDVLIEDVKIIGARSNSDGITTQSCERLTARNCFVRGWDDNLVVKGYDGDARDILFEGCVLWTDLAQSCEIGYETRADVIERVTFRDITVLHNFHKPVLSIHNSDNALVRDVSYENIIVEDAQMGMGDGTAYLIELTTSKSQWSKSATRGSIRDVVFNGVTVLSGKDGGIRLLAASKDATIDSVTFSGLNILGKEAHSAEDVKFNKNNKVGTVIFD